LAATSSIILFKKNYLFQTINLSTKL